MSESVYRGLRWGGGTVAVIGVVCIILYFVTQTHDTDLLLAAFGIAMVGTLAADIGLILG